ncbi:hypothetical protein DPX16_10164 [Anabarilius grahami]|uniref:Uncharacterized protein n=1 Tax=Anabarilius grahami TaxID=495550 RepID=A0A3N0XX45_ANAGA|nr:hypothetical protein DPX16_10164 [Anabarilius grahami]
MKAGADPREVWTGTILVVVGGGWRKELLIEAVDSKAVHQALEQSYGLQPITEQMEMVSLIQSMWADNNRCAVYLDSVLTTRRYEFE